MANNRNISTIANSSKTITDSITFTEVIVKLYKRNKTVIDA